MKVTVRGWRLLWKHSIVANSEPNQEAGPGFQEPKRDEETRRRSWSLRGPRGLQAEGRVAGRRETEAEHILKRREIPPMGRQRRWI